MVSSFNCEPRWVSRMRLNSLGSYAFLEEGPGTQQLKGVPDHEVADGQRVRVGREDHLDAAGAAGRHIDILKADTAPGDHLQPGAAGQQFGVHPGVGADHKRRRLGQGGFELG